MNAVKERLMQFIESKGFSNRAFAKMISTSPNILSTASALGSDILIKISINFPNLNIDWVVTGRGEMLYRELPAPNRSDKEEELSLAQEDAGPYEKKQATSILPLFEEDPALSVNVAAGNTGGVNHQLLITNYLFLRVLLREQAGANAERQGISVEEARAQLTEKLKEACENFSENGKDE